MKRAGDEPGASLGRILTQVLTDAVVGARAGILPHELTEKWKHNEAFMKSMERDGAPLFQAMFEQWDGADTTPPALQAFIDQAGGATHDLDWILQILGFLGALFAIIPALGSVDVRPFVYAMNNEHQNVVLSPADLADGVMRGVITDQTAAYNEATQSGVNNDRFAQMVELIGEPPGLEECLAIMRRGDITNEQMDEIIAYSRVNTKYTDLMYMIASSYMSPADVIELAIKGVVDTTTASDMFMKAGGYEGQFEMLYEGAGDAIGNEAVLRLLNQGLATEDQVKEVFGRSRMNPLFYDLAMNLRYKYLEPFQIGAMVKANPSLADQAATWLLNLGYDQEQVTAFIATYAGESVATSKSETESMITQLYQDRVITAAQAEGALSDLGYDQNSSEMILGLSDAKMALSQQSAAVSAIRNAVVKGKITIQTASGDLDQLGIPPEARDQWLSAWEVEYKTQVRTLTAEQLGAIAKKGVLTGAQLISRYVAMGYSQDDAELLAANYGLGPLVTQDS